MTSGGGGATVEKVVRDRNTIVQITVHTKPTADQPRRPPPERRYLDHKAGTARFPPERPVAAAVKTKKSSHSRSPHRRVRSKETAAAPTLAAAEADKEVRLFPDNVRFID